MSDFDKKLRREYRLKSLDTSEVKKDPVEQFNIWFDEAIKAEVPDANAMTLATVDNYGHPSARIVLLKEVKPDGFVFYTNYNSRKGKEIANNPCAALVFYWPPLERQVRIEGVVEKIPYQESDEYFNSRPMESRFGAIASPQSKQVKSRDDLEQRMQDVKTAFQDKEEIHRPSHWGGYLLAPQAVEFWQGRENRLHDRILYKHEGENEWNIVRLAP